MPKLFRVPAVGLMGLGLAFGVWTGSERTLRRSSERELIQAWTAFAKCMLGDTPLGGDLPSVRFRAIELGPGATDWPARCAPYQAMLSNASRRASGRFGIRVFEYVPYPAESLDGPELVLATPEQLDTLYGEAARLPPGSVGLRGVPSAPPPADLVRLSKLSPLSATPVLSGDLVARGDLRLLFADKACWFRAADDLATATCFPVSGDADRVLAGSEDGTPPVLLPRGDTAFVTVDGTTVRLGKDDPHLVRTAPGGESTRLPSADRDFHAAYLTDDALLWAVRPHAEEGFSCDSVELYARSLRAEGELGETAGLGRAPDDPMRGGCRSGDTLFLLGNCNSLYTRQKEQWLAPAHVDWLDGLGTWDSISCSDSDAAIVRLSFGPPPRVAQTRCAAGACSTAIVTLPIGLVQYSTVAVTSIGDAVVVAYENNGLRVRVGRLNDLPTAPDHLVLDSAPRQPGAETLSFLRLYARGPFAVLVVEAATGTFGFRINGIGTVTPVDVTHVQ